MTRDDVVNMYKLVLSREPESPAAIDRWLTVGSFFELLEIFVNSDEYKSKNNRVDATNGNGRDLSLSWPPCSVETETDVKIMDKIFSHIKEDWTSLGEVEPYYSVLSTPEYLSAKFPENTQTFFESGQGDIARLQAFADRAGVKLPVDGVCLELGCGVGRLTRWLADHFQKVVAVDISMSHINLARINLEKRLLENKVDFVQLQTPTDLEALRGYDVFFSVIVIQHNPPPIMSYILKKILAGLNRGGFAYFQVPTYRFGYSFEAARYVRELEKKGEMEMHVLPQSDIFRIADQAGCKLLEVREDDYTGHLDGVSNTFFFHKP